MTTVTVAAKPIGRVIKIWTPEDKTFWVQQGQAIATRNLWISVPALFLAFAVWQLMSVVAVKLPQIGFRFTTNEIVLARRRSGLVRRDTENFLFVHGADIRRPPLDRNLDRVVVDSGDRHRHGCAGPEYRVMRHS